MSVTIQSENGRRAPPVFSVVATIAKTLGTIAITMLGLLFITFVIGRIMPIDPLISILGERASKEMYEATYIKLGLDKPLVVQFFYYLWDVVRGDFGVSRLTARPVVDDIIRVFPATLELATIGTFIGVFVGIPLGVVAAVKRGTWIDQTARVIALVGYSMPIFWLGLMEIMLFAVILQWFPSGGRLHHAIEVRAVTNLVLIDSIIAGNGEALVDALKHLALPALALATIPTAIIARMTRSSMLDVLQEDYIRTAHAKGLQERVVLFRHALKNAFLPIVTIIGLQSGSLLAGAVLTETIFAWPGIGKWVYDAILGRDYPVVQGGTLLITFIIVFINLLVDLSYVFLDPRIHYE